MGVNRVYRKLIIYSKMIFVVLLDIVLVNLAALSALMLRFDFNVPIEQILNYIRASLVITIVMLGSFYIFNLYKSIWRYASIGELLYVFFSCFAGSSALYILFRSLWPISFPRSFYLIFWLLTVAFIGGTRFTYRMLKRTKSVWFKTNNDFKRVMIIGGGIAGALTIKELNNNPQMKKRPVAIIDDDPSKYKKRLNGVPVCGGSDDIERIARDKRIDEIIIAMPSAHRTVIKKIVGKCNKTGCRVKTLPGIFEIIDGKIDVKRIRDVEISDLLGRSVVSMDLEEKDNYLKDGTILVTGGGGSIGSELCWQVARFSPRKIIILDNYENNAYEIHRRLTDKYESKPEIEVVIASIQDRTRIDKVFDQYRPTVVFHAAAHKHVPLMETSPGEAIKNNVLGTKNVVDCAHKYGVDRFILISTDKAVNPTNVMGATKRIAEMLIHSMDRISSTKFAAVRFGNVLGSNGSVIPLFKKQIAAGGPVTVTHPDIVRFFMTIPEAVQLVIHAGAMTRGGEIFVLDMGNPVKIADLANDLIRLSGFEPGKDIEIKYIGLRPGEKLYEELLLEDERLKGTTHPNIFYGQPAAQDPVILYKYIEQLEAIADYGDPDLIHDTLKHIVPEYHEEVAATMDPNIGLLPMDIKTLKEQFTKRNVSQSAKA